MSRSLSLLLKLFTLVALVGVGCHSCSSQKASRKEAREALETELIHAALQKNQGKISRAAIDLGVSRPTLYELMEKLGIKREKDEA